MKAQGGPAASDSTSPEVSGILLSDPALRLLRSPSALFVIPFLHGHFRSRNLATIPSDDLETSLATFLKENGDARNSLEGELGELDDGDNMRDFAELKENADWQAKARKYVSLWCSDRKEYLRRYYNRQNVPVLELTPSLERLFTQRQRDCQHRSRDNADVPHKLGRFSPPPEAQPLRLGAEDNRTEPNSDGTAQQDPETRERRGAEFR